MDVYGFSSSSISILILKMLYKNFQDTYINFAVHSEMEEKDESSIPCFYNLTEVFFLNAG